ncbi:MAG: hypothetical protein GY696_20380, partial [Gammaproteobacteria bacterium]|nr:hypothetical protein [Gammaproteobacteria bacterium]
MSLEMVRSLLVKLPSEIKAPNEHVMVVSLHHAIMDAHTIPIIIRDLLTAYHSSASGADAPAGLPRLSVEYADYAMWQWQHLEMAGHLEQQLEYWAKQLANTPISLNLPFDRQRHKTSRSREGSSFPVFLPGKLIAPLADLCVQHRTTLFVGLMAAFQLMLSRLAGNIEDLVVGIPNAGRDNEQLKEVAGCIVEHLVIRGDLKGNPTFSTLLERQRLAMTDALQHADVSFSQILERLQVSRIANCNPVYQVSLNFMDNDEFRFADGLMQMRASGLEFVSAMELQFMKQAEQLGISENGILARATDGMSPLQNLDLHLHLFHVADTELLRIGGIEGVIIFNSTLFDRSTAVMMFECFENLLVMAVENPHKVVWDLPMLTQSEEQRQ